MWCYSKIVHSPTAPEPDSISDEEYAARLTASREAARQGREMSRAQNLAAWEDTDRRLR